MHVLKSIDIKARIEDVCTPKPWVNGGKKAYKHNCDIPMIYFTLYAMLLVAQGKTAAGGMYYCPDCKTYHHKDGTFLTMLNRHTSQTRKYLSAIQDQQLHYLIN